MLTRHLRQRGDTLIEVLFAITIFSLIMVGAVILMNQGSAAGQRALEISLVRQQIDGQAETLRFLHDSYLASPQDASLDTTTAAGRWRDLLSKPFISTSGASPLATTGNTCPTPPPTRSFVMNPATTSFTSDPAVLIPAVTHARVGKDDGGTFRAYGMWIEAVESPKVDSVGFIDFHIRACWSGPGSEVPMTLGTIVRLYDKS